MPRMRKPAPLRTLSGRYIVQNFWPVVRRVFGIGDCVSLEQFLASEEGDSFVNYIMRKDFYSVNPFGNVGEFFSELVWNRGIPEKLDELVYPLYIILLRPRRIGLCASMTSTLHSRAILERWSFQHVQELWIRDDVILDTLVVPSIIQTFSNLEVLLGIGTNQLVLEVSKHCPRLKKIDLSSSVKNHVNDAGLVACSRLSQLTSLSLSEGKFTVDGIQYLLDTSPKLQSVTMDRMSDVFALAQIYARYASTKRSFRLPEYSLRELIEDSFCSRTSDMLLGRLYKPLSCAVALCPHVTAVSLGKKVTDEGLRALVSLSTLSSLNLSMSDRTNNLTFAGGIVPVLKKHGKHLKKLLLRNLSAINVAVVAHLCCSLETLEFADCYLSTDWPPALEKPDQPKTLSQLKRISVSCGDTNDCVEDDPLQYWSSLMLSPHLEDVKIDQSQFVNDSIVDQILDRNKFPNLKRLIMHQLDNVSAKSIWNFLFLDNGLDEIEFYCHNDEGLVTENEMVALEDYCAKFDLWFNFRWRNGS